MPLPSSRTRRPGSISVAITLGATPHPTLRPLLVTSIGHALGILVIAISVYLCYRYAHVIVRMMNDTARAVLMRLSSFVLVCIGVQIAWNGVHGLVLASFPHLPR
ncbi:MAG TPA: MarC family protein [Caldimonas sp.]|nr:MarC family protein [Caldimonas sp.]